MLNWIALNFPEVEGNYFIYQSESMVVALNETQINTLFSSIAGVPSYEQLMNLNLSGWNLIFDDWKNRGLIN
jgi:hypothetical protein